jgi:hypothetical protein
MYATPVETVRELVLALDTKSPIPPRSRKICPTGVHLCGSELVVSSSATVMRERIR